MRMVSLEFPMTAEIVLFVSNGSLHFSLCHFMSPLPVCPFFGSCYSPLVWKSWRELLQLCVLCTGYTSVEGLQASKQVTNTLVRGCYRFSPLGCSKTPVKKSQVLHVVVVILSRLVNDPTISLTNLYKAPLTVTSEIKSRSLCCYSVFSLRYDLSRA